MRDHVRRHKDAGSLLALHQDVPDLATLDASAEACPQEVAMVG